MEFIEMNLLQAAKLLLIHRQEVPKVIKKIYWECMLMICFALQLRTPCDEVDLEEKFSQMIENILSFWGSEDNPPPPPKKKKKKEKRGGPPRGGGSKQTHKTPPPHPPQKKTRKW